MAPARSRKRKPAQEEAGEEAQGISLPADAKRQKKLPVRVKEDEERSRSSSRPSAAVKGALKVFDDEDGVQEPEPVLDATSKSPAPADGGEAPSEDSDDDAPEAVSAHQAAVDVKESAKAAQKAVLEQAAAQKRKRQHRDALFKQQAEERKKNEKEATAMLDASLEQDGKDDLLQGRGARSSGGRKRLDKVPVPTLLPTEYLTDSSSEDEDDEDENGEGEVRSRRRPRKVSTVERTLTRLDIAPRDKRVGSTVYRVAQAVDERTAPKLHKYSKGVKQMLLKRNRPAVRARTAFFTKR